MPSLRRSVLIALTLFVLDAFVTNQGFFALLAIPGLVFIRVPFILAARKDAALFNNRVARAWVYAAMAAASLVTNALNNAHARRQAGRVIAACGRFQAEHGRFPDTLERLVPGYLPAVPRAKFVLGPWSRFRYDIMPDGRHWLEYTALPPFGRPHYVLEEGRWGYLD